MANIPSIKSFEAAIFDVDDTLLDNRAGIPGQGLHERSRLAAVSEIGDRYGIPELQHVTVQENQDAFLTAPVHTLESAIWNLLTMKGLVDGPMQPDHQLLTEIAQLKNNLHESILLEYGEEVPGSTRFVRLLARHGLQLAVASTAVRRDVDTYFRKVGLTSLFLSEKIITKEQVIHYKPHPEVFDTAFRSLGLPESSRRRVLAFEDDPRGIMSAKAAGLITCAITTRFDKATLGGLEIHPDLIADSYEEFEDLLGLAETKTD